MNSTSFGELGGRVALVDGGSVLVGWPGAPGCTTTGARGSACCAQTGTGSEAASALAAISALRHTATFTTDLSFDLLPGCKHVIGAESQ